jgi:hypothetical protein
MIWPISCNLQLSIQFSSDTIAIYQNILNPQNLINPFVAFYKIINDILSSLVPTFWIFKNSILCEVR